MSQRNIKVNNGIMIKDTLIASISKKNSKYLADFSSDNLL